MRALERLRVLFAMGTVSLIVSLFRAMQCIAIHTLVGTALRMSQSSVRRRGCWLESEVWIQIHDHLHELSWEVGTMMTGSLSAVVGSQVYLCFPGLQERLKVATAR